MEEKNNNNNVFESNADESKETASEKENLSGKKKPKKNIIITFLLSLLAAVVMWIVAVDYEITDYEKDFTDINIKLVGAEQTGMQIDFDDNVRLDITVSGKRSHLSTLKSSSFEAIVDVSGITKEGKSEPLQVEIESVNGITLVSQSMTHLTVVAEKRVTDTFEVVPLLGMAQLENGVNYSLVCDTKTVTVTGSESIVSNIKRAVVYVDPEPKNVTESFKSNCQIVLESDIEIDMSQLTLSPRYCQVEVVLTKEKSVPVEIKIENGAEIKYEASFHPSVKMVVISGEPRKVDEIDKIYLNMSYDKIKNQLGSGKNSFTVNGVLEYPEQIVSVNGETEISVLVDISTRMETVSGESVVINGCPLGYTVKVSDVEIKLTGLYEEIEVIKSSDITVSLNLSGVVPSEREQKVKGGVIIQNPYGTVYETQCLVSVTFVKTA